VHHVIDRYLSSESDLAAHLLVQTQHYMPPTHDTTSELNNELANLTAQLEASRKRKEMLESALTSKKGSIWIADVAELGLGVAELETVKAGLERVWAELEMKRKRFMLEAGFFPNGYGYREGFGYGFEDYGHGLFGQNVNPMISSAAPMNVAVPPEALLPALPDLAQYSDLGFYFLHQ
jgi:hypothetical protein